MFMTLSVGVASESMSITQTPIKPIVDIEKLNAKEIYFFDSEEELKYFLEKKCFYKEERVTVTINYMITPSGDEVYTVTITHEYIYIEWDC